MIGTLVNTQYNITKTMQLSYSSASFMLTVLFFSRSILLPTMHTTMLSPSIFRNSLIQLRACINACEPKVQGYDYNKISISQAWLYKIFYQQVTAFLQQPVTTEDIRL